MRAISDLCKVFLLVLMCGLVWIKSQAQDTTPPELRCKTGLVVVLPVSGTITMDAAEFDDGSSDDVTPYINLKFYLNGDPSLTSYTVNCDTFEGRDLRGEFSRSFFLHVEDEAGNVSICGTMLRVQDNKFICGEPYIQCSGCPFLWYNNELINAKLNCSPSDSGCYSVTLDSVKEVSYCLDEGILNGVTTKDLVQIQRHLLGITAFEHPFQMVAADVNNSQSVSAADISSLRKVILGSEPDFQRWGLDSYRFIVQSDTNNPTYTDVLTFEDVTKCPDYLDFWAIKTGDVAFEGEQADNIQTRSNLFKIESRFIQNSHAYSIISNEEMGIAALDIKMVEDRGLEGVVLKTNMGGQIYSNTNESGLRGVWLSEEECDLRRAGDVLMEVWHEGPLEGRLSIQVIDRSLRSHTQELVFENEERISLWPNPVQRGQRLAISGLGRGEYSILDVNGRLITRFGARDSVDILPQSFQRGVYFVVSEHGALKARFVVD